MIDVGFGMPVALGALLVPAAIVLAWRRAERHRDAALGALPAALLVGASRRRRAARCALLALAVACLVLAAARPQWGRTDVDVVQRGIDLAIVLDVSRSMLAEDVAPSRAEAAAEGMREMLQHLAGNRVGLVTFAGSAFERSPLTVDLDAITSLVVRAQQEAPLVDPGTNLASAIHFGLATLDVEDAAAGQAILLVTDGEQVTGEVMAAVAAARDRGVRIYTVFAATDRPTALPEGSGGTDVTLGDRPTLARVSEETGGTLREIGSIPGLAVEFRRLRQTQFDADVQQQRVERFPWFIGAALALIAAELALGAAGRRRLPRLRGGLVTSVLLGAVLVGCGTTLYRDVERGNEAYREHLFEDARESYAAAALAAVDDPAVRYNLGNALHQLGRLEEATIEGQVALAAAEDPELRLWIEYALGNVAFRAGDLGAAYQHYVAALRIDPADADAKANLELVLRASAAAAPDGTPTPMPGDPSEGDPSPAPGGGPTGGDPTAPGDGDATGEDGGPPGPGGGSEEPGDAPQTLEEARSALAEALAALGDDVSEAEALRILELARRANELAPLPSRPGGGVPPR